MVHMCVGDIQMVLDSAGMSGNWVGAFGDK